MKGKATAVLLSSTLLITSLSGVSTPSAHAMPAQNTSTQTHSEVLNEGIKPIQVEVNGRGLNFSVQPFIENGSLLVPLRSIFDALGAEVKWDEYKKVATVQKKDLIIELKPNSYFVQVNGETIKLAVQSQLKEDTLFVPLRFISETFGAKVDWDAEQKLVKIEKNLVVSSPVEKLEDKKTVEQQANEQTALTYEKAVEKALKESYRLKNEHEEIKKTEELRDRVYEIVEYSRPSGIGYGSEDNPARQALLSVLQMDTAIAMGKKRVDITEEAIAFQVKTTMDEIIKLKKELQLTDLELTLLESKLKLALLKEENGLESGYNLTQMRNSLTEEKKKKEAFLKSLDEQYIKLNQLTGMKEEGHYSLAGEIAYTPLEELNLDTHIYRVMDMNPHLWLQNAQAEHAERERELYAFNVSSGQEPYEVKNINVQIERNKLATMKQGLEESLRTKYNQLQQIEKQYEVLQINEKKAQEALQLVRVQYDAGMAINIQLEEAGLAVQKIRMEMLKLAVQHEKLKMIFYRPYLAPDYLG